MSQEILQDLGEHIKETKHDQVILAEMQRNELCLTVKNENFLRFIQYLRDDQECLFKMLLDITVVDYPSRKKRFDVVYNFLSLRQNNRIRIKCPIDENESIPSLLSLYKAAGWYEREAYDMYGVIFDGNPDLRRILTDYGFEGHPLRKDFPLTGYHEVIYDPELQRVVYEPVKLTQDYRNFDFESPWEGMTDVQLPGDEKAVKPRFSGSTIADNNASGKK